MGRVAGSKQPLVCKSRPVTRDPSWDVGFVSVPSAHLSGNLSLRRIPE